MVPPLSALTPSTLLGRMSTSWGECLWGFLTIVAFDTHWCWMRGPDSLHFDLYQRCSVEFRSGHCVDHTKPSHPYVYDLALCTRHCSTCLWVLRHSIFFTETKRPSKLLQNNPVTPWSGSSFIDVNTVITPPPNFTLVTVPSDLYLFSSLHQRIWCSITRFSFCHFVKDVL